MTGTGDENENDGLGLGFLYDSSMRKLMALFGIIVRSAVQSQWYHHMRVPTPVRELYLPSAYFESPTGTTVSSAVSNRWYHHMRVQDPSRER
jgi:hypothetical protein